MPRTYTQEGRLGKLHTPLPDNDLVLLELAGTEGVNQIAEYRIKALGTDELVNFDDLLGKAMRITLSAADGADRIVTLTCVGARYVGTEVDKSHIYEFELRPWIWLMDQRINSRIFNEQQPIDIITTILQEHQGIEGAKFEFHVNDPPEELEYCVQYGESDLSFVRRLMEEFGLNFFIRMEERSQVLVVTDNMDGFAAIPGASSRPYYATGSGHGRDKEHFSHWLPQRGVTPGAVKMVDYNFKTPTAQMETVKTDGKGYAGSGLESYHFPGRYGAKGKGDKLAQKRLNALRGGDHGVQAQGEVISLGAGMKVSLDNHDTAGENAEYLCSQSSIHLREGGYTGGSGTGKPSFHGHFRLVKTAVPLAPPTVTKKAVIQGPQTGLVVGSNEIDCDEYGRILVQFPWAAGSTSMRCRVQQAWAGKGWGAMQIPRKGMEVLVEFLNGDPDCPIVVGCVYNADNMPPFDLPGKKAVSGIMSKTHEGSGYNQISLDDSNGSELMHMHAQKDLDVKVENDTTIEIVGNRTEKVTKKLDLTVNGDRKQKITTDDKLSVTGTLAIDAGQKLSLKVGSSEIEMTPMGISIKAAQITIEAQMALTTKGGLTADHSAGTMLTVKGLMVMIN
ncbi:MAG: type VI secretion system tip protein TssI/VgrG [Paracoccaceae bacterium]